MIVRRVSKQYRDHLQEFSGTFANHPVLNDHSTRTCSLLYIVVFMYIFVYFNFLFYRPVLMVCLSLEWFIESCHITRFFNKLNILSTLIIYKRRPLTGSLDSIPCHIYLYTAATGTCTLCRSR